MREIVLDTETTGLDPASGHRIVEIGCVEIVSGLRSGKEFHKLIDPQRDMPEEAQRIHGHSAASLRGKPVFSQVVDEFLQFIADSPLVIHNAGFDMKFLNHELKRHGFAELAMTRAVDTVMLARRKFPGSPVSLDALCKRFEIDLTARDKHGALLDAQLLADVYLELTGGRQVMLALDPAAMADERGTAGRQRIFLEPRVFAPSPEELEAHAAMLASLKGAAMWLQD